jgi:beta-lysine 5,6-aminomutase alpha subunit
MPPPPPLEVPLDRDKLAHCRELAGKIAADVQTYIDAHTSVGVERAVLRAYGVNAGDNNINRVVDKLAQRGELGRGVAFFLGSEIASGRASDPNEAAACILERSDTNENDGAKCRRALEPFTKAALARIDEARETRVSHQRSFSSNVSSPLKYVIVATGNVYDDADQAKAAASSGADIVAVIRATAQSLLDYVPEGATTEGFGGTFATQENFRIIREATNAASKEYGRYIQQTNYSSGLCMAEIAWMGAVERLDMLLNDAMYGILFRDINPYRNFVDQYMARRLIARAGIVINTGEDNYLTTADAREKAHTVLASQLINEAFALRAGVRLENLGLGHAFEIDPSIENSFLLELSQAQLIRQVFPIHPIKWMPPTKHKTGDIFQSHVLDAMFNLVGIMTDQSIVLLGMLSEAVHNPLLMDRHLSLKSTRYIFHTANALGRELTINRDGIMAQRAVHVLNEAHDLLTTVQRESLFTAIERGLFADVKRKRTGGKGYAGVVPRAKGPNGYINPILDALENNHI